ncbi:hypothetical protein R1flu_022232 [Riccia fluitans]|uniref:Peptidase A2 domain-containing protein n=1 Tax=Riccia fluitans TaxID=41844 RepID=A0ABD1ZRM8_9MARC
MPREVLLRTASTIRQTTGWDDPMETLSVHAYIANTQHEALVEEKRRREDVGEGTSTKRKTWSDSRLEKSQQDLLPTDVPMAESTSKPIVKEKAKRVRGTTETLVTLEGLDELVVALIDNGSEINIVSKNLYKKAKWSITVHCSSLDGDEGA